VSHSCFDSPRLTTQHDLAHLTRQMQYPIEWLTLVDYLFRCLRRKPAPTKVQLHS